MKNLATLAATAVLFISAPAFAQEEAQEPTLLEKIQAQTALETAKAARARAEADRIAALGIPSFDGKTELSGDNAGAMEAEMLSAAALRKAASKIATSLTGISDKKLILLTQSDNIDFSRHVVINTQIEFLTRGLRDLNSDSRSLSVAGALALVQAGAGLLRSETTLSGVAATSLDDEALLWLTGQQLKGKAKSVVIPTANVGGAFEAGASRVINNFEALISELNKAKAELERLSKVKKPDAKTKAKIEEYKALIDRTNTFVNSMTTADDDNLVPLVVAARQADLMEGDPLILRLHVNKAGGSLVNTKNIATTFGVDPLKVSGAVLVSYLLTDPKTGGLEGAGLVICRTSLVTLRKVHQGRWQPETNRQNGRPVELCTTN